MKLTVQRYGQKSPLDLTVTRDVVKMTNVPYYGMVSDEVGYIDLKDFTGTASREVRTAFQELKGKGMKKLVLDVRENPADCSIWLSTSVIRLFRKIRKW